VTAHGWALKGGTLGCLPAVSARLGPSLASAAICCFNVGKEEPHQCGFRAGRFGGEFLQGVAEAIWCWHKHCWCICIAAWKAWSKRNLHAVD